MRALTALFVFTALALLCACPKRYHQADPPPERGAPAQEANVPLPVPPANVVFVPPPPDPLLPERETFTAEFSKAANGVFPNASWTYREVKLYEHPKNEWAQVMLKEISRFPTVVVSYHGTYTALFTEMASKPEVPAASYILMLTPVKSGASPLIKVLEPRMEEVGFLAGITLATISQTTHLASATFKDYEGDRFVSGFYQGVKEVRGSVTHSAIYFTRSELIGAEDSAANISSKLVSAGDKLPDRRGIDSIALFLGPLAKPFIETSLADGYFAITGPAPLEIPDTGIVTSFYIDFGKIPQFLVENAEELKFFSPKGANIIREGADMRQLPNVGNVKFGGNVQYVSVGLKEGILNYTGFALYQKRGRLPAGLENDIQRITSEIIAGERTVTLESPK